MPSIPASPDAAPPADVLRPPEDVKQMLYGLRDVLDDEIPRKRIDDNLLIGTWNLRAFGGLTSKWVSEEGDSPRRNFADVRAITDVISRFDVCAVQESRGNLKALRTVMQVLGQDWGFILTDVTEGAAGNDERLAFIYDMRRVKPSGLAAEIVIPQEVIDSSPAQNDSLRRQFARTPYAVSFQAAGQTFILVTLHLIYGHQAQDRTPELQAIANWLRDWAKSTADYGQNLICLGDFNIDRKDDPNYQAFTQTGLRPPPELDNLSRTTSDKPGKQSFYDQIAWFTDKGKQQLTLNYTNTAGRFEWTKHLLTDVDDVEKTWRISDHYPLWAEFSMRERATRRV
jgi:endonuclease/exonuclease/phosphatase family metal-dependent hydrolase